MISHKYKCIFIHIPKTAGTSIEALLCDSQDYVDMDKHGHKQALGLNRGELKGGLWRQHFTYTELFSNGFSRCCWHREDKKFQLNQQEYQKKYGDADKIIEQDYFKFAFIRNPLDKLVSEYAWRQYAYKRGTLDIYVSKKAPADFKDFVLHLENHLSPQDAHVQPQYKFIYDDNHKLQVDYVGRFEELNKELQEIAELIGAPFIEVPRLQGSNHDHYKSYYSPELESYVRQKYKIDFDLGNY
tara:strand:+ start:6657 stop:7382 length:726 start_codon:yes stop_codon:yes gene_type:complete